MYNFDQKIILAFGQLKFRNDTLEELIKESTIMCERTWTSFAAIYELNKFPKVTFLKDEASNSRIFAYTSSYGTPCVRSDIQILSLLGNFEYLRVSRSNGGEKVEAQKWGKKGRCKNQGNSCPRSTRLIRHR